MQTSALRFVLHLTSQASGSGFFLHTLYSLMSPRNKTDSTILLCKLYYLLVGYFFFYCCDGKTLRVETLDCFCKFSVEDCEVLLQLQQCLLPYVRHIAPVAALTVCGTAAFSGADRLLLGTYNQLDSAVGGTLIETPEL